MKKFGIVLLAIVLTTLVLLVDNKYGSRFIPYTELVTAIQNGDVETISMKSETGIATITMVNGEESKVKIPSMESFSDLVTENAESLEFKIEETKPVWKTIVSIVAFILRLLLQLLLLIIVPIAVISSMNGNGNSNDSSEGVSDVLDIFGTKGFAHPTVSFVTFKDVAGIDEEMEQLQEIVEFLKDPTRYERMGAKVPKGVLLSGPPGTGKTLLAKAIAGEAEVPVYQVTGSSFEEKFVGVGSSRVRTLFKKAREDAPAIIFIDEFDAIGLQRYGTRNNYSEQTLNQLLSEMDGFKESSGIIVIAATNHKEVLDEAITRPGRFDRKIEIPMPDLNAREKILKVHARGKNLSESVSLEEIAKKTVGFSGADLQNLLNESAIIAVNRNAEAIEQCDVDEAFARVIVGLEKKGQRITEEDKYQTAVHEAGHAVVSMIVRPKTEILGISIVPRGSAGGYNLFNNNEKSYSTKEDAIAEIEVAYGGRAAEEVILKKVTRGPASDLQVASKIAYGMVVNFAMKDSLLTAINDQRFDDLLIKTRLASAEEICQEAYANTKKIVENNKAIIEKLAELLMKREVLSLTDIKQFISENENNFIP